MGNFNRTTIAVVDAKQAALYFDYVIPLNLAVDMLREMHVAYEARKQRDEKAILSEIDFPNLPPNFADLLLPSHLLTDVSFRNRLAAVNESTIDFLGDDLAVRHQWSTADSGKRSLSLKAAAEKITTLISDFDLSETPVDAPDQFITEGAANDSDVAVRLSSLKLVDVGKASWEQIFEFRRDSDAHDKLRRLRLFAWENYSGKSKDFIEDDILVKIANYEAAVKKWGFETKYGAFTSLISSKILAGAFTGSLISTFFGAPVPALASAVLGIGIEISRIALEVSKQQFALRSLMAENPVCYISQARSKLEVGAATKGQT